jgi:ATP adenylyltransferase
MPNRRRFDWVIDPTAPPTGESWDRPVLQTEQFLVMPSKGSLVPGWLLVVPRRATLNLRDLSSGERGQLNDICRSVRTMLHVFGGRIFEFEHGADRRGSLMGCGVDQAHLHVVPLPFDLLGAASRQQGVTWTQATSCDDPWQDLPANSHYLLAKEDQKQALIGIPSSPTSQWFRRIIANELRVPDKWHYSEHPFSENVARTLEVIGTPANR